MSSIRRNINCKECGNINPKGRSFCSDKCAHTNFLKRKKVKREANKHLRPLINGLPKSKEIEYYTNLANVVSSYGELRKLDTMTNKRSYSWLVKYCKPKWILSAEENYNKVQSDKNKRNKERVFEVSKLPYVKRIVSSEHKLKNKLKIQFECTNGHILTRPYHIAIKQTECSLCSYNARLIEDKNIKKAELQSWIDAKKLVRDTKYAMRVDKLNQFVSKKANYTKYNSWAETPIWKEYHWYNNRYGIKYRQSDLTYKLQSITYYVYRTGSICPDKPNKIGYKICNKCKKHKMETNFIKNQCKDCVKEYRREFILPNEKIKGREAYKNDPLIRLNSCVKTYIHSALKGKAKSRKTVDILGMSIEEFRNYVESNFENWMHWGNHGNKKGQWTLQHIVPRDFATNEAEIYLLNYHKNLIPMCATENSKLQNRILNNQLNEWHNTNKSIKKIIKRNKDRIVL